MNFYNTTVKEAFNDKENNLKTYHRGDKITLNENRYNFLLMKGKINKGELAKEKDKSKTGE